MVYDPLQNCVDQVLNSFSTESTRRRHSPSPICRTEGVICFEVARGVYSATATAFSLCSRPATPVVIPSRAGFSVLSHHDMRSDALLAACARCGKSSKVLPC